MFSLNFYSEILFSFFKTMLDCDVDTDMFLLSFPHLPKSYPTLTIPAEI